MLRLIVVTAPLLYAGACSLPGQSPVVAEWVRNSGGPGSAYIVELIKGPDQSLTAFGYFLEEVWFGQGGQQETLLVGEFEQSAFLARYTTDGEFAWAECLGSDEDWFGLHIAEMQALPNGDTLAAGRFKGRATFGRTAQGDRVTLTPEGWVDGALTEFSDLFVARYDQDGRLVWVVTAGGADNDGASGIAVSSDRSVLVMGSFVGQATFGKGEPGEITLHAEEPSSYGDIFIARYAEDGTLGWVVQVGGPGMEDADGIALGGDDTFLVVGEFGDTVVFGRGEQNETVLVADQVHNIFVARYHLDGSLIWAKKVFSSPDSSGPLDFKPLDDGSFLLAGHFYRPSATLGPGDPNETTLVSERSNDTFIARYDPQGELVWVTSPVASLAPNPYGGDLPYLSPHELAALPDGSFYVTGALDGEVTFGQGEVNETTLIPVGQSDGYLARHGPDGRLVWATRFGVRDDDFPFDFATGVSILDDGSIAVAGAFGEGGPLTIGDGLNLGLTANGLSDTLLMKLVER